MNRRRRWIPTNSRLWRISSGFWMLNAVVNAVTAVIAATPSVYLALGGINLLLAAFSALISTHYRRAEYAAVSSTAVSSRSFQRTESVRASNSEVATETI